MFNRKNKTEREKVKLTEEYAYIVMCSGTQFLRSVTSGNYTELMEMQVICAAPAFQSISSPVALGVLGRTPWDNWISTGFGMPKSGSFQKKLAFWTVTWSLLIFVTFQPQDQLCGFNRLFTQEKGCMVCGCSCHQSPKCIVEITEQLCAVWMVASCAVDVSEIKRTFLLTELPLHQFQCT